MGTVFALSLAQSQSYDSFESVFSCNPDEILRDFITVDLIYHNTSDNKLQIKQRIFPKELGPKKGRFPRQRSYHDSFPGCTRYNSQGLHILNFWQFSWKMLCFGIKIHERESQNKVIMLSYALQYSTYWTDIGGVFGNFESLTCLSCETIGRNSETDVRSKVITWHVTGYRNVSF